jgi:hypothetical protein
MVLSRSFFLSGRGQVFKQVGEDTGKCTRKGHAGIEVLLALLSRLFSEVFLDASSLSNVQSLKYLPEVSCPP